MLSFFYKKTVFNQFDRGETLFYQRSDAESSRYAFFIYFNKKKCFF